MRTHKRLILDCAVAGILCVMTRVVFGDATNEPAAGSAIPTNSAMAITRTPLVIKGLYGSAAGHKSVSRVTAAATANGLRWLRDSQNANGSWGMDTNALTAETGLSLLAFLAHGDTPASPEFGTAIEKGIRFLMTTMSPTNGPRASSPSSTVGHAISTWALCESYSMTRIPVLKPIARDALAIILKGQRQSGLWDSSYRTDGGDDAEASVWQVLALKGGLMGDVMDEKPLREALRRSADAMKEILAAQPDTGTVAGAVLCLQLCGEGRNPVSRSALKSIESLTPDWNSPSFKDPMFRWHLATQAFFHEGAQPWVRWNRLFNPMLVEHQVVQTNTVGQATGYWASPGDGERFGRTYSTALALLMLQVYQQRHLPMYQPAAIEEEKDAPAQDVEIHVQ